MEINKNKSKQPYLIGFFLILILPLLNIPPLFSPPDWGKTIIFIIILSFLIFLSLYHIFFQNNNAFSITIKNKLYEIIKKKLLPFWLLISFLLLLFLATIFSLNPSFSFWGSPYRAGGFLNSLFYVIFSVLAFLILKKNDWKKIWNFSFIIGILVALIAIFQQFNLFSNILISDPTRPASTVGGPIFLAIYLLLLSFLALSFGLKEKNSIKKLFYLSTVAFFLFTIILITQTRAAFIGLTIGFLWFLLFYPIFSKKLTYLKISFIIILLLAAFGVFYINTRSKLPRFFEENKVLNNFTQRLSISNALSDVRFSGWIILSKAVKSKPLLGYGPENLSIGFDKYYNLSIPNLTYSFGPGTGWWDRAHNFVFDISVTSGIPTLLIYLLLLSTIFWQLQKLKKKNPPESIIYHGIQATLIAYVATNFLSFDTFSTYLIFFLLISYSLFLIFEQENTTPIISNERLTVYPYRKITIAILLFIPMIWFIWEYNIKPLQINKEINWANYYSKNKKYEQSIEKIEGILESHSFL
ncbi:MAG TPA: hypothetical protein ENH06_01010, partial [bacterium]|nr:hypothetical protein [bacterium]